MQKKKKKKTSEHSNSKAFGRQEGKKKKLKWLVLFKMLDMPPFGETSLPWV